MKGYLVAMFLCLAVVLAAGCSHVDEHHNTTTTTLAPAPSFLGIDLGDSPADVITVLGTPENIYIDPDTQTTEYVYNSQMRTVVFNLTTLEVIAVISANFNDSLDDVEFGDTKSDVLYNVGKYDEAKTGQYMTIWVYNSLQLFVAFPVQGDYCIGMGIFAPGELEILLNIFD